MFGLKTRRFAPQNNLASWRRAMSTARLLTVFVLAGIYAPVFAEMARIWWTDTYAVHGMFVPLFSAYFFWMERDRLRAVSDRGNRGGIPIILLGLAFLALGRWERSLLLQGASLVAVVTGLILWRFGTRCLKAAAFPVGFLLFMVPLPRLVVNAVTLHLQLFAANFSSTALQFLDIPVYLNGVLIELPSMTLEVAEICNGLRFLMALVVLVVAFAQVTQRTVQRKAILVASAIPIAILANATRVAIIAAGAYYVGPQVLSGFIHHTIGKAVWAMTLIPLAGIAILLRRGGDAPHSEAAPLAVSDELKAVGDKLRG